MLDALDPARTALLVVDMQNAFVHDEATLGVSGVDVSAARATVGRVRRLVEGCNATRVPVLWSQHVHVAADAGRERKRLPSHRLSALAGGWNAEIADELSDLASADPGLVFRKHRSGCFYQTRLDAMLRALGTEALLVCGATGSGCVETTLREARLRDYDVVAVTDCIAIRPQWESVAQAVWAQHVGVLATSAEVLAWLVSSAKPRATGLGHVLLQVSDLEAAERFYVGTLGMTVRDRGEFRDGRPLVVTHQGLGLTNGRPDGEGALEHVAFYGRDVGALAERARVEGVQIVRGPEASGYGVSLYLSDPDGNVVEVFGKEDE